MHLVQHTMYLVYVFRAVMHDLSVLHVVVILFTFLMYFLRINMDGWMDGIIIMIPEQCLRLLSHCESSPGPCDECRTAPEGFRSLDKEDGLEPLACFLASFETTSTVAIYYYSDEKPILILLSRRG